MRKIIISLLISVSMIQPVFGMEFTAPEITGPGAEIIPQNTQSFSSGMLEILNHALSLIKPDFSEIRQTCLSILSAGLLLSLLQATSYKLGYTLETAGAVTVAFLLLNNTHSMIQLSIATVTELSEYEKLLLPVMTAAVAAQGGITTASALYVGTMLFISVLSQLILQLLVPFIYLFIALSVANCAAGEDMLAKLKDILKNSIQWILKNLLIVFTTYLGITGVISGKTDALALKATRLTISSVVPVIGGILSDASEAVLISAELAKNSVGIYGIFAILAIFVKPFVKIGIQYLSLKYTAAVCSVFCGKRFCGLVEDFSVSMSLLLAITGAMCTMLLVSCICFLKGVG